MDETPPPWAVKIMAKLDRIEQLMGIERIVRATNDTLTTKEVAERLRCSSPASLYRLAEEIGVKPYAHNKWRRGDIENAVARAAYRINRLLTP